jgi:hypothetical protein
MAFSGQIGDIDFSGLDTTLLSQYMQNNGLSNQVKPGIGAGIGAALSGGITPPDDAMTAWGYTTDANSRVGIGNFVDAFTQRKALDYSNPDDLKRILAMAKTQQDFSPGPSGSGQLGDVNIEFNPYVGQIGVKDGIPIYTSSINSMSSIGPSADRLMRDYNTPYFYTMDREGKLTLQGGLSQGDDIFTQAAVPLSFMTGGLSDVARGDSAFGAPISEIGEAAGLRPKDIDWIKGAISQFNPVTGGVVGQLQEGYKHGNMSEGGFDWGRALDRVVDPAGTIDYTTRLNGDLFHEVVPELDPYWNAIGTTVGGVVGSLVPGIGTAVGAGVGSGIGSKLGSGNREEDMDYMGDLIKSGVAAVAADATSGVTPAVTNFIAPTLTPILGSTAGNIVGAGVGGAAGGAVKGGLGSAYSAYQQGSFDPMWKGAASGVILGGLTGAGGEAFNQFNATAVPEFDYTRALGRYYINPTTGELELAPSFGEAYQSGQLGIGTYGGYQLPQFEVDPMLTMPSLQMPGELGSNWSTQDLLKYTDPNYNPYSPNGNYINGRLPDVPTANLYQPNITYDPNADLYKNYQQMLDRDYPMFQVDPELKYAAWMNPLSDYTMGGATTPNPIYNPSNYGVYNPQGPGALDYIKYYGGKGGDVLNQIKDPVMKGAQDILGIMQNQGGPAGSGVSGEGAPSGMVAMEMPWTKKGSTQSKGSKGLGSGEAELLAKYLAEPYIPQRIANYRGSDLYR